MAKATQGWVLLLVVLAVSASCRKQQISRTGLACDQGRCEGDYVCDPLAGICVTSGDSCSGRGGPIPCLFGAEDCSQGCRTCVGGEWSDCMPLARECEPGSARCEGGETLILCSGVGTILSVEECGPAGCNLPASPPRCNDCRPGEQSCDGTVHRVCDADGRVAVETDCASGSQCANAGVCDPATGCSVVAQLPNGTPCDDGDPCWVGEECRNGNCTGGAAMSCAHTATACRAANSCDPAGDEGNCSSLGLAVADATACDDGDACTVDDVCADGSCVPGAAPDCATTGSECSLPATCDPGGTVGNCAIPGSSRNSGAPCSSCAAGSDSCTVCIDGLCQNGGSCDGSAASPVCTVAADCQVEPGCVDASGDCLGLECGGGLPSYEWTVGPDVDWRELQHGDDPTAVQSGIWYCNETDPVPFDGVLYHWRAWVESAPQRWGMAQLAVVRCDAGHPPSNCLLVGIGGSELAFDPTVGPLPADGDFTLVGATQMDGTPPDLLGIVVRAGDTLCVNGSYFSFGVDCDGSSAPGCLSVVDGVSRVDDLSAVRLGERFDLQESAADGHLLVGSTGLTYATPGHCSSLAAAADGSSCQVEGGDTCCGGLCVVGAPVGTCN